MKIEIDLPMPPSTNKLWRSRHMGGNRIAVYQSQEYRKWTALAGHAMLLTGRRTSTPGIIGRFRAQILLSLPALHGGDGDNRVKALFDWAQKVGLIENDRLMRRTTIEVLEGPCDFECRLTLESMDV